MLLLKSVAGQKHENHLTPFNKTFKMPRVPLFNFLNAKIPSFFFAVFFTHVITKRLSHAKTPTDAKTLMETLTVPLHLSHGCSQYWRDLFFDFWFYLWWRLLWLIDISVNYIIFFKGKPFTFSFDGELEFDCFSWFSCCECFYFFPRFILILLLSLIC